MRVDRLDDEARARDRAQRARSRPAIGSPVLTIHLFVADDARTSSARRGALDEAAVEEFLRFYAAGLRGARASRR